MFDMLIDVLTGEYSPMNIFEFLTTEGYTLLIRSPADNVMTSTALATFYSAVIPIALILIVIGFMVQLTEMAMNQQFSVEKFVKNLIILVIMLMVLDNGVNSSGTGWIQKLYDYSKIVTNDLAGIAFSETTGTIADNFNPTDSGSIIGNILEFLNPLNAIKAVWNLITTLVSMLTMSIMGAITSIFVYAIGLTRAVKLGIYVTLSPIAMACAYTKSPGGVGYLKKVGAIFLQEAVIILSTKIMFAISNGTTNVLSIIVIALALISGVITSEAKAKELLR